MYIESAQKIQVWFKSRLRRRYSKLCLNSTDTDCITLEPVYLIPRDLFIVVDEHGFDSRGLLKWLMRSNVHPWTRKPVCSSVYFSCMEKVHTFIVHEEKRLAKRERGLVGDVA